MFRCRPKKVEMLLLRIILVLFLAVIADQNGMTDLVQNDYKVTLEWAETVTYNKRSLKQLEVHIFKYNRTCSALNFTIESNINLGHDVVYVLQAYKFASNEYRHFPMRFQFNLCEGLLTDIAGSRRAFECGNFTGCPFVKGITYHVCNFVPDDSKLPPYIPGGRYKIEIQILHNNEEIIVVNAYIKIYRPEV